MSNVSGALVYLKLVSLGNSLRARLVRLKQPKYLVGALVGGAYLFLVFGGAGRRNGGPTAGPALWQELFVHMGAAVALALTVLVLLYWIVPRGRAALAFSEPEIAFLFPGPLSRRTLIHYRLISSQLAILLTVAIFTLLSRNWPFMPGAGLMRFAGFWIVFATIGLHAIGSSFVITKWLDRGVTSLRRQLIAFGVLASVVALLVAWTWSSVRTPLVSDLASAGAIVTHLATMLDAPPVSYALTPAAWVLGPLFAPDGRSFLLALAPALLVYALHYFWVLRVNVTFEEASIDKTAKRASRLAALRAGGTFSFGRPRQRARREPFALGARGRPEIAFLWKNLLSTAAILRPRTALVAAAIIGVASLWLTGHPEQIALRLSIGTSAAGIAAYVLLFGPLVARQDLRRDLLNADLLKTYPLHPWQIVLGEILAPLAILTVLLWLLLFAAALTFQPGSAGLALPLRTAGVFALALNLPLVCALQLLVANATTLVFPAWFAPSGQQSAQGIDSFGQRLVAVWGQVLLVLVALIPAGVLAFLVFLLGNWLMGIAGGVAFAALAIAAVLAAEVAAGVWWLGRRFERFDLSAELRT
jgi:hypothetical protein